MSNTVNPIPERYGSVTPYLIIKECADAIDYYKKVFGATEGDRMNMPDGRVGHTELTFGDSVIMMASEFPEQGQVSPTTLGGTSTSVALYVEDVDRIFAAAVDAGATVREGLEDKFYGDRSASITDPFGHQWFIASHIEDVTPEEMQKRMEKMLESTQS